MGFIDDVETVLKKVPEQRQVALFSATMPAQIKRIAQTYLKDPVEIAIKAQTTTAANISSRGSSIRIRVSTFSWPSPRRRSEEHTSELQSLMRNSYAVFS